MRGALDRPFVVTEAHKANPHNTMAGQSGLRVTVTHYIQPCPLEDWDRGVGRTHLRYPFKRQGAHGK
ncbi:hypothetical protein BaRGS_00017248 [Batillaria attramentaria]|uniref:Uncharacterized protein n=1 Tax=Batillaria attramentaria TaxID=370345 RepID=A0ABD0KWD4_9CAEN